jgi:predicted RNase H-related nuclease YkuK (DUF458 family)
MQHRPRRALRRRPRPTTANVHADVGVEGETRGLIREVVGMIVGSGFTPHVKPESFGASTVADRYTK